MSLQIMISEGFDRTQSYQEKLKEYAKTHTVWNVGNTDSPSYIDITWGLDSAMNVFPTQIRSSVHQKLDIAKTSELRENQTAKFVSYGQGFENGQTLNIIDLTKGQYKISYSRYRDPHSVYFGTDKILSKYKFYNSYAIYKYNYLVISETESSEDGLKIKINTKLFNVNRVPISDKAKKLLKPAMDRFNADCLFGEDLQITVDQYMPEITLIDEVTIVIDYTDPELRFGLKTKSDNDINTVSMKTIKPYLSILGTYGPSLRNAGGILKGTKELFQTESWNVACNMLKKYPMLRTFWRTYHNINVITRITGTTYRTTPKGDYPMLPDEFKQFTTPEKALGISKTLMQMLSDLNTADYPTSRLYKDIKVLYNQCNNYQIVENLVRPIFEFAMSHRFDEDMRTKAINLLTKMDSITDIILRFAGPKWKNYDVDKLVTYLTTEVELYQGIVQVSDALQYLIDYYKSMDQMRAKITDKFPKSLRLTHDIAAMNAQAYIDEHEAELFKDAVSVPKYQSLAWTDKEYCVKIPTCAEDIVREGREQSHCVGSYVATIRRGDTMICFMRKTEDPNTPVLTLQVNPKDNELVQYRGFANRDPSKEEMDWLKKWCKHVGINVHSNTYVAP